MGAPTGLTQAELNEYFHACIAALSEAMDAICLWWQQDVGNSAAAAEVKTSSLNAAKQAAVLAALSGLKDKYKKPKEG
jgi:hypothetical protein